MNIYLIIIFVILIGEYLLNLVVEILNLRHISFSLPEEFNSYYSPEKYKKSQEYIKETTIFGIIKDTVFFLIVILFIIFGGFNFVDRIARSFNLGYIPTGLIFAGIILLGNSILEIPFSIYHNFVIEEKYGFNRTTPKTFITDIIKTWILVAVIGGIIFSFILWFFDKAGSLSWIYCWITVTLIELFLLFVYPVVILPLFNKFIPLEEGELRTAIEEYANAEKFKLKGIFKMDASRRTTKSNAFFIGFGKYKRIVLFDTLINKHTTDEIVSVLAHEMGHYKKHHFIKNMIFSFITAGIMFYILSLFINNRGLFDAFKMEYVSIYASIFFFGFLYTPVNMFFSIIGNIISRKHEYEADIYAVKTYKKPDSMINALKKLSVDNLSNLTPHPLKVFLEYSHPPVLARINNIRNSVSEL